MIRIALRLILFLWMLMGAFLTGVLFYTKEYSEALTLAAGTIILYLLFKTLKRKKPRPEKRKANTSARELAIYGTLADYLVQSGEDAKRMPRRLEIIRQRMQNTIKTTSDENKTVTEG